MLESVWNSRLWQERMYRCCVRSAAPAENCGRDDKSQLWERRELSPPSASRFPQVFTADFDILHGNFCNCCAMRARLRNSALKLRKFQKIVPKMYLCHSLTAQMSGWGVLVHLDRRGKWCEILPQGYFPGCCLSAFLQWWNSVTSTTCRKHKEKQSGAMRWPHGQHLVCTYSTGSQLQRSVWELFEV